MKITMIGKSGVGKTSFMSGMHEALHENRVGRFCILPSASNLSEAVIKAGKFDEISYRKNNFSFPAGTQKTTLWSFDLCYGNSPVCELEWIDYRGGILDDMFASNNSKMPLKNTEIEELLGHISISNGVILFADSVMLSQYEDKQARIHHSGARIINKLLQLFSVQYPNRNLSVVIVLTKADSDLVKTDLRANDYSLLIERGIEAFHEVVELCQMSYGRWYGGIIPVGTVGVGKVKSTLINSTDFRLPITVQTEMIDMPHPFNVEHPLFHTIGYTLSTMKDVTNGRIDYYRQQVEAELEKSSLLRNFWCKMTGTENPKNTAEQITELLENELSTLNQIEPYIRPLLEIANSNIKKL